MSLDRRSGFTLVELAVVLTIIAAIVGVSLAAGDMQIKMAKVTGTQNTLETVRDALNLYQQRNHRFPCPAPSNAASSAATYGIEAPGCWKDIAIGAAYPLPAGIAFPAGTSAVIGGVPFKTLGIGEDLAYDKWSHRITYAIDIGHVVNSGLNTGTLHIVDAYDSEVTQSSSANKAIFVLVAHGPNGAGAPDRNGNIAVACGATGARKDVENCDRADDRFREMPSNQGDIAANYFDDQLVWQVRAKNVMNTPLATIVDQNAYFPPQIGPGPTSGFYIGSKRKLSLWGHTFRIGVTDDYWASVTRNGQWLNYTGDEYDSCGVMTSGLGYCRGYNSFGKDGTGTSSFDFLNSRPVDGNYLWKRISLGRFAACGVTRDNIGYCWGMSVYGAPGAYPGTGSYLSPNPVAGNYRWDRIDVGWMHACGVTMDGLGYCWGPQTPPWGLSTGALGVGDSLDHYAPAPIAPTTTGAIISDWKAIHPGNGLTCGVTKSGRGYCWGSGGNFELGNGTTASSAVPSEIMGNYADWSDVQVGPGVSCGLRGHHLYCWGKGNATLIAPTAAPTEIPGGYDDWQSFAMDINNADLCGIRNNSTVWCIGSMSMFTLDGPISYNSRTPYRVPDIAY